MVRPSVLLSVTRFRTSKAKYYITRAFVFSTNNKLCDFSWDFFTVAPLHNYLDFFQLMISTNLGFENSHSIGINPIV